jgi:SagB-type dehydrogenase family enzyme
MKGSSVITAESIGTAARFDPQLRVPKLPRVRRGLVIRPEPDELVVEGGPKRQLFRGKSATALLPSLLDRLDGQTGHETLASELDISEDIAFKALSLLWACGVIEEGPPTGLPAREVGSELADYLSRIGDSTGANASWEQAAVRLESVRLEVFGAGGLAEAFTAELASSLDVRAATGPLPRPDTNLVVWADFAGTTADETVRHCWDKGIPLVRIRLDGRTAELGPMVDPRTTPCLYCLSSGNTSDDRTARGGDVELAAALFARDLFAMISRSTPSPLPSRWRKVNLDDLSQSEIASATRPGCELCSTADGSVAEEATLPARYEASVAMPPKEFADLKAHQMHYKPSNLALQRKSKTWPVAPKTDLPTPPFELLAPTWEPQGTTAESQMHDVDAEQLSLILMTVVGTKADTEQKVLRWTASGGNIGSVTAYVVVRSCDGILPGTYGYLNSTHQLARLSARTDTVPGDAPVTMVLGGDYRKVAEKYSAFALRIVFLDSGCAQATAREVCSVLGIEFHQRQDFDDRELATGIGLDTDVEPITAVLDLGGAR